MACWSTACRTTACRTTTCRLTACRFTASRLTVSRSTTFEYISNCAQIWPRSASPNPLNHRLQVYQQTHLITASRWISLFTWFRSQSSYLGSLDHELHPSTSPDSQLLLPSASLHIFNGVTRCSSDWIWVLSAARLNECMYIDRPWWILHAILQCTKSCDWNKDKYDTWNGFWIWNPKNNCCDNMAPSSQWPAELCRGLTSSSRSILLPCTEGLRCSRGLLKTSTVVSAALISDCHRSQILQYSECTSWNTAAFQPTWEIYCSIKGYFALLQGGLGASGVSQEYWWGQSECLEGLDVASRWSYIVLVLDICLLLLFVVYSYYIHCYRSMTEPKYPLRLPAGQLDSRAHTPSLPFVPTDKWISKQWTKSGKKRKGNSPLPSLPPPESASASAPYCYWFRQRLPDFSSHQEAHCHLLVPSHGKHLSVLYVSASACFPASRLSHCLPECFVPVSPQAAMTEEVLRSLGHRLSTPPAVIVLLVAKPCWRRLQWVRACI